MTKSALPATVLGAMLVLLSHAPVHAQAARTWVASAGNDANACSRTLPCKTFAVAVARTAAGGEVNCVDADEYGRVTITKSISIVCDNTEAGIFAAGTVGITVNTLTTDSVTLKGIDIEGFGTGTAGISFIQGGALHVHKVRIRNFRSTAVGHALGINFAPTVAAALYVSESYIPTTEPALAARESRSLRRRRRTWPSRIPEWRTISSRSASSVALPARSRSRSRTARSSAIPAVS